MRTPVDIIKFANQYSGKEHLIINEVDKKVRLWILFESNLCFFGTG